MRIYRILVLSFIGLVFTQCQKDEDLGDNEIYSFTTNVSVNYNTDTISQGDTLWFESEIVGYLVDSATQKNIYFGDANINLNLLVRSWNIENQIYQPDYYNFKFSTYIGYISYTDKATLLSLYYYSKEGKYLMKFGVVFNSPGIYSIDGDYMKFENYFTNETEYFGGGTMSFQNLDYQTRGAYIKANLIADNRNMHLYNELSDDEKNSFQVVDDSNQSKYFFIKVNE